MSRLYICESSIKVIIIIGPLLMIEHSVIHHTLQLSRSLLSAILRGLRYSAPVVPVFGQRPLQYDRTIFSVNILRTFSLRSHLGLSTSPDYFHGGNGVWMSCWMGGREGRSRLVNVWLALWWKSFFT